MLLPPEAKEAASRLPAPAAARNLLNLCCKPAFPAISAGDQTAVDFIGRVEHIDEDFRELVALINARRNASIPPLEVATLPHLMQADDGSTNSTAAEEAHRRSYAAMFTNNTALADVARYYARDFELLKYPKDEAEVAEGNYQFAAASGGAGDDRSSAGQAADPAEGKRPAAAAGQGGGASGEEEPDGPLR